MFEHDFRQAGIDNALNAFNIRFATEGPYILHFT